MSCGGSGPFFRLQIVSMFVDVVPNRNSRPTILIRHAYREGGKAKKRTLANITKLPPETVEKIREILREAVLADAPAELEGAFEISRSLQHGNAAAVLAVLALAGFGGGPKRRHEPTTELARHQNTNKLGNFTLALTVCSASSG